MSHLLLALLCAAPLMMGHNVCEASQPVSAPAAVYRVSMGCDAADCVEPTHYHHCAADCTDHAHYHDCPVGCTDPAHPHHTECWEADETARAAFCPSMGCDRADCTDPTHYHLCAGGCTDPSHYHDCPVGCQNAAHPHSQSHHGQSQGHHGNHH